MLGALDIFIENKEAIEAVYSANRLKRAKDRFIPESMGVDAEEATFTAEEWALLEELRGCLTPAHRAAVVLQGDYPTPSQTIPLILGLTASLKPGMYMRPYTEEEK